MADEPTIEVVSWDKVTGTWGLRVTQGTQETSWLIGTRADAEAAADRLRVAGEKLVQILSERI